MAREKMKGVVPIEELAPGDIFRRARSKDKGVYMLAGKSSIVTLDAIGTQNVVSAGRGARGSTRFFVPRSGSPGATAVNIFASNSNPTRKAIFGDAKKVMRLGNIAELIEVMEDL